MATKTASQKNNDRMLKVIALVCAILLWFYAEAQENPSKERQITVPVQYVNLTSEYVIEGAGQSVQVTVKGNETDIMSLRSDDFSAVVDLQAASVGSVSYPVQVSSTTVTERFTYAPDKLTVVIDEIQQKEVPVQLRTSGEPAPYYEVKYTDVQPDTVTIRGKSSLVENITAVETVPIDISGIAADKELLGLLQLPEGVSAQTAGTEFRADADVAVHLYVQPMQGQRVLEALVEVRNVPEGFILAESAEKVSITLKGDAKLLETQPILDQVLLYVDCSTFSAGTYTLPIQVETSNDAVRDALYLIEPQEVTVTLLPEDVQELPDETIEADQTANEDEITNE